MLMKAPFNHPDEGGVQDIIEFVKKAPRPHLLQQPLLRKLIAFNAPELLDGSRQAEQTLTRIGHYLFDQKNLKNKQLESELPHDLFLSLYSLKSMLQWHDIKVVASHASEHKKRMKRWIEMQIEEEEE